MDLFYTEWRNGGVTNFTEALVKLNSYKWCSHYQFINPELIEFSPVVNSFFAEKFSKKQTFYLNQIKQIITNGEISRRSAEFEFH